MRHQCAGSCPSAAATFSIVTAESKGVNRITGRRSQAWDSPSPVRVEDVHPELPNRLADDRRQRDQAVGLVGPRGQAQLESAVAVADRVTAQVRAFGTAVDPGFGKRLRERRQVVMPAAVLVASNERAATIGGPIPDLLQEHVERREMDRGFRAVHRQSAVEPGRSDRRRTPPR